MDKKRYATKSEWAAAQASKLRAMAAAMRYESSGGSTTAARRKFEEIANLRTAALEWDAVAAGLRRKEARFSQRDTAPRSAGAGST